MDEERQLAETYRQLYLNLQQAQQAQNQAEILRLKAQIAKADRLFWLQLANALNVNPQSPGNGYLFGRSSAHTIVGRKKLHQRVCEDIRSQFAQYLNKWGIGKPVF